MTFYGHFYDCCPCCDPLDEWHVAEGDDRHEEPCEGGCNDDD
jgi:hypothetical protein